MPAAQTITCTLPGCMICLHRPLVRHIKQQRIVCNSCWNSCKSSSGLVTGPGLAVRVLGDVTEGDALDVLRHVDEVYVQTIRDYSLYDKIWQAFAVFLPVR